MLLAAPMASDKQPRREKRLDHGVIELSLRMLAGAVSETILYPHRNGNGRVCKSARAAPKRGSSLLVLVHAGSPRSDRQNGKICHCAGGGLPLPLYSVDAPAWKFAFSPPGNVGAPAAIAFIRPSHWPGGLRPRPPAGTVFA